MPRAKEEEAGKRAQEEEAGKSGQTVHNGSVEMHDLSRLYCIKFKDAPQPH